MTAKVKISGCCVSSRLTEEAGGGVWGSWGAGVGVLRAFNEPCRQNEEAIMKWDSSVCLLVPRKQEVCLCPRPVDEATREQRGTSQTLIGIRFFAPFGVNAGPQKSDSTPCAISTQIPVGFCYSALRAKQPHVGSQRHHHPQPPCVTTSARLQELMDDTFDGVVNLPNPPRIMCRF